MATGADYLAHHLFVTGVLAFVVLAVVFGGPMFPPAACFKSAIALPVVAYAVETGVYHHHGRGLLVFVAFMGAVPAFFGLLGLFGG